MCAMRAMFFLLLILLFFHLIIVPIIILITLIIDRCHHFHDNVDIDIVHLNSTLILDNVFENYCFRSFSLVIVCFSLPFYLSSHHLTFALHFLICIFILIFISDLTLIFFNISSIENWKDPVSVLEENSGAAWKLIFKLLARGRLYDNEKEKPLQITGNGIVRENKLLFYDTYDE